MNMIPGTNVKLTVYEPTGARPFLQNASEETQRRGLLAMVHIAKKDLGLNEGEYEMILRGFKVASSGELNIPPPATLGPPGRRRPPPMRPRRGSGGPLSRRGSRQVPSGGDAMNADLTINMTEITVRQKDSLTHTKFILLPDGRTFPEDNFNLAKEWMEAGLLSDRAAYRIKRIIEATP